MQHSFATCSYCRVMIEYLNDRVMIEYEEAEPEGFGPGTPPCWGRPYCYPHARSDLTIEES